MSLNEILQSMGLTVGGKLWLPNFCKRVKIDVGLSFSAPQSANWLENDPNLIVFGFEPVRSNLEKIFSAKEQSIYQYLNKRMFVIPIALGSRSGVFPFYVTSNDAGRSSPLKPAAFEISSIEFVNQFTLNEFLDFFPFEVIPRIDYLKTDCQGSDLDVLIGAQEYLHRIAIITSEADDVGYINSDNSFEKIQKFLVSNGFICINPRVFQKKEPENRAGKIYSQIKSYIPIGVKDSIKSNLSRNSLSDDPTFFNNKFLEDIIDKSITYYQKG